MDDSNTIPLSVQPLHAPNDLAEAPAPPSSEAPFDGMVWIPGGTFQMGSNNYYPEEAPVHTAQADGFWMDQTPITNTQFQQFIEATGYATVAERVPNAADYPGADPAMLVAGSSVFKSPGRRVDRNNHYNWWQWLPGTSWRRPAGPQSSLDGLDQHPVVHVAWEDVEAYARWIGKELATEAEWEFAARGGLEGVEFAWGDELTPGGKHMANTWQGEFPYRNLMRDGFAGTSPVGVFPPNCYGLYDLIGNVWEWTVDWYGAHQAQSKACCTVANPRGGVKEQSYDPQQPHISIPRKVIKGGSHLCAPNYCQRYRPAARMPQPVDTSTSHIGFRCIMRNVRG